jgi:Arc/MetJ family transcription regulator
VLLAFLSGSSQKQKAESSWYSYRPWFYIPNEMNGSTLLGSEFITSQPKFMLDKLLSCPFFIYVYNNVYKEVYMRTNIVLDDALVEEAFRCTGAKTKKELVSLALQELVENRGRKNMLDLEGRIQFTDGYDYKALRSEK